MEASVSNVANYRSKASLVALQRDLDRSLSVQQKKIILFEIGNRGLMVLPWWTRPIKTMFGKNKWAHVMAVLWEQNPELLDSMWRETMEHMVNGTDRVDPKSAGGYNSDEMNQFTEVLKAVRYVPGNVLTVAALTEGWFIDDESANARTLREEFCLA